MTWSAAFNLASILTHNTIFHDVYGHVHTIFGVGLLSVKNAPPLVSDDHVHQEEGAPDPESDGDCLSERRTFGADEDTHKQGQQR